MFRPLNRRSLTQSSYAGRGWSPHVFRLPLTRLGVQYRTMCVTNLAVARRSGVRNVAGFDQYKFRHRVESKPVIVSITLESKRYRGT